MVPIFDAHYKRAGMRINLVAFLLVLLAISAPAHGQPPAGFNWWTSNVNLQPCKRLNRRSKVKSTQQFAKIVLADGFALVTAVRRESWQTTPAEDQWLYIVSRRRAVTPENF